MSLEIRENNQQPNKDRWTELRRKIAQRKDALWQEIFELTGSTPEELIDEPKKPTGILHSLEVQPIIQSTHVKELVARYLNLKRQWRRLAE